MTQITIHNPNNLPTIDYRKIQPLQGNLKDLTRENYDKLKEVLIEDGFRVPFFVWHNTENDRDYALDGHQRKRVMTGENMEDNGSREVPYVVFEAANEHDARKMLLRITSQYGTITQDGFDEFVGEMQAFDDFDYDESLANIHFDALPMLDQKDNDGEGDGEKEEHGKLNDAFLVPPFSVLDTRQGYWQERSRAWGGIMGSVSESREGTLGLTSFTEEKYGRKNAAFASGVSELDPVMCEVMYAWFGIPNGTILNPFGGEPVSAIVAAYKGYEFTGVEVRPEQVVATYDAVGRAEVDVEKVLVHTGDSTKMDNIKEMNGKTYDMVFSSPPFYDLEVYSDQKDDLSNIGTYKEFMEMYTQAFTHSVAKLKNDRFVVINVTEIRDKKKGNYRNFVGDNVKLFTDLGLHFYNDIILLNAAGTAMLRAKRNMATRKVVRVHQNLLVFYKGDIKNIKNVFPQIEVKDAEDDADDVRV
jgi:hypothetical protein